MPTNKHRVSLCIDDTEEELKIIQECKDKLKIVQASKGCTSVVLLEPRNNEELNYALSLQQQFKNFQGVTPSATPVHHEVGVTPSATPVHHEVGVTPSATPVHQVEEALDVPDDFFEE